MPDGDQRTSRRILQVALELFNERGYEGTPLRDVAERLGITTAALYYHFKSKDHILLNLARPMLESIDALIERSRPAAHSPHARRALLGEYLEVLLEHRELFRLLGRDVGALNRQGIGARMQEQDRRLQALLVGPAAKGRAQVQAAAALGALRHPVIALPEKELEAERESLLDAAMAALTAQSARARA